jgi:hypothetical protein
MPYHQTSQSTYQLLNSTVSFFDSPTLFVFILSSPTHALSFSTLDASFYTLFHFNWVVSDSSTISGLWLGRRGGDGAFGLEVLFDWGIYVDTFSYVQHVHLMTILILTIYSYLFSTIPAFMGYLINLLTRPPLIPSPPSSLFSNPLSQTSFDQSSSISNLPNCPFHPIDIDSYFYFYTFSRTES